jgi:hypothetical protein
MFEDFIIFRVHFIYYHELQNESTIVIRFIHFVATPFSIKQTTKIIKFYIHTFTKKINNISNFALKLVHDNLWYIINLNSFYFCNTKFDP